MSITPALIEITRELNASLSKLTFHPPVTHVYNPLIYGRKGHEAYLNRYASTHKKVVFLGMNPGPFGMAQTAVPFGEIAAVRDWMGIETDIGVPEKEHPKRPITGFACPRSEVSGRRLWGLFSERFESADSFFGEHFVANYCPLVFMEETGRNRTPDKLPRAERDAVYEACDHYLRELVGLLRPTWLIGVGDFALTRATKAIGEEGASATKIGRILHPSPASPLANRGWGEQATKQLKELGVWS